MKIKSFVLKTSSKLAWTQTIWAQSILSLTRKFKKEKKITLEAFKKLEYLIRTPVRSLRQRKGIKRILLRILLKYCCPGLRRNKMDHQALNGFQLYTN